MDLFPDSDSESGSRAGATSSSSSSSEPDVDIIEAREDKSGGLNINRAYAARFQHNNERAELHRLEEKYGRADAGEAEDEIDESSDGETEDEEGEQMTADVDAAILSMLAKIRRKDESIYETGKRVFDEEKEHASRSKLLPRRTISLAKDGKRVTLGEYQRKRIQELLKTSEDPAKALAEATMIERRSDGAHFIDGNDDVEGAGVPLPHSREQEELRLEVTKAFHTMANGGEGDGDDLFTTRRAKVGSDDLQDDDDEGPLDDPKAYRKYLIDVLGGKEDDIRQILRAQAEEASLDDASHAQTGQDRRRKSGNVHSAESEQENEEFLANYILNRGWMDDPKAMQKGRQEIVDERSDAESNGSFDSRAEAFEDAYNHRFQEMEDGIVDSQIQSYARQVEGSARRMENKRKREREGRAKRKEEEKEGKRRELNKMRDLKRKSIVERLRLLKEATGSASIEFDNLDLNADFDPDEHDRLMERAFDQDYYDADDTGDMTKPSWDEEEDTGIEDILREQDEYEAKNMLTSASARKLDKKKRKQEAKAKSRTETDAGPADLKEGDEATSSDKKVSKAEKKKLKKREKAKARKAEEAEEQDAVAVDAEDMDADTTGVEGRASVDEKEDVRMLSKGERKRKMEEMMNEYYGLEYEDMIGDQPTRFKYTEVPKSDFGLTSVEILLADDAELNKIVGLKRLQPYQFNGRKSSSKGPADLKARLRDFRRGFYDKDERSSALDGDEGESKGKQKKAGKRERERKKAAAAAAAAAAVQMDQEHLLSESNSKETTKRKGQQSTEEVEEQRKSKKSKKSRSEQEAASFA